MGCGPNKQIKQGQQPNSKNNNIKDTHNSKLLKDGSTLKQSSIKKVISNQQPKSKMVYHGDSMQSIEMKPQDKYIAVNTIQFVDAPNINRQQNYAQETHNARVSKLHTQKEILSYQLDTQDGVSKTPQINTFQYSSALNHNLNIGRMGQSKINSSSIRKTNMQNK